MRPILARIARRILPKSILTPVESSYRLTRAVVSTLIYGHPARRLKFIGVTGTNGKTTASFMIHRMLVEAGIHTGLMTTVAYGVDGQVKQQIAHMTTVSTPLLQKRLAGFVRQGAEWVVLETTSHALAQHRAWGIPYEIAVMTNVTHEHLDFHGTFRNYLSAKLKLFEITAKSERSLAVVNADDPNAEKFQSKTKRSSTYGLKAGDLRPQNLKLEPAKSSYDLEIGDDKYHIVVNIPGEFNVMNSLAAIAVGRELGLTVQQIEQGIASLESVEGRMTTIDQGQKFNVIVDFAHTPDAFERMLSDVRASTAGKLIVLFGSAGRRDQSKRAIQGEIAGRYGDEVILTEEDDRDIDGNEILDQIATGATKSGKQLGRDLFKILDRPSAIDFAMTRAASDRDTVILLGKGHEKTIERADGEHPWDESAEARRALRELLDKSP